MTKPKWEHERLMWNYVGFVKNTTDCSGTLTIDEQEVRGSKNNNNYRIYPCISWIFFQVCYGYMKNLSWTFFYLSFWPMYSGGWFFGLIFSLQKVDLYTGKYGTYMKS